MTVLGFTNEEAAKRHPGERVGWRAWLRERIAGGPTTSAALGDSTAVAKTAGHPLLYILGLMVFVALALTYSHTAHETMHSRASPAVGRAVHQHEQPQSHSHGAEPPVPSKAAAAVAAVATAVVAPRIAIVTYITPEMRDMRGMTLWNKEAYARTHNYTVIDAYKDPAFRTVYDGNKREGKSIHFMKFVALQLYIEQYDWLLWSDADSFFLNFSQPLAEYTDDRFDVVLTTAPPSAPKWYKVLNNGHFLVRASPWTRRWLAAIYGLGMRPCTADPVAAQKKSNAAPINGWLQLCSAGSGHYWLDDQGAVMSYFRSRPEQECHVKYTNFRDFNSEFPWYDNGDLVVHFPGRSGEDRKRLFGLFYEYADFRTGTVNFTEPDAQQIKMDLTNDGHSKRHAAEYAKLNVPCAI